jgi:exodeoxyribonuclease VII large subunit
VFKVEERYLTVTALTKYIKYKFDHDYNLEEVLLEGEISNFRHNSRGHFYFTLKDENASISVIMFATFAKTVKFEPKDGMKVFVKGNVSVYEPQGTYRLNIKELKSDGVGDLYLAFQKLKEELEKEGLFDPKYKKRLPMFPNTVGVITSPTGAAIKDIINTISRRYPLARVVLYPAIVQGDGAKDNIVKQIKLANEQNICDVLIVGRGGGSIEDLWAFNERVVAMAIFDSQIPIISAVGHEIDVTISDLVADMRAATPTAAAELATPSIDVLKENIKYNVDYMNKVLKQRFDNVRLYINNLERRLDNLSPVNTLKNNKIILDQYKKRLNILLQSILNNKKNEYRLLENKLSSLNPFSIMDKGYSINSVDGKVVSSIKEVNVGDTLETKMKDGTLISTVTEVKNNGK